VTTPLIDLQLAGGPWTAYQPDTDRALTVSGTLESVVPADHLLLTVLRSSPGALWSTSGVTQTNEADRLEFEVTGPAEAQGLLVAATPSPLSVTLDGQPLPSEVDVQNMPAAWWSYDAAAGVLRVHYQHEPGVARRLAVTFEAR
jgi:hypothetical protein